MSGADFAEVNRRAWVGGRHLDHYASRHLRPAEATILLRYREQLGGRVLEVGCGPGRLLGYVAELGGEANGLDLSPEMLEYAASHYPRAHVREGDMADPGTYGPGPYDVIWVSYCLIDELTDADRRRVLSEIRTRLGPGGLLIFSSANLDSVAGSDPPRGVGERLRRAARTSPAGIVRGAQAGVRRRRNRRERARLEERHPGYAILVVGAHDDALVHYHIRRDDQERQLAELGYELLECLDLEGQTVGAGELNRSEELHYIARPVM